ncbi:hypothetical protein BgiBS90_031811, partial [Biomphalaria glabrata]
MHKKNSSKIKPTYLSIRNPEFDHRKTQSHTAALFTYHKEPHLQKNLLSQDLPELTGVAT